MKSEVVYDMKWVNICLLFFYLTVLFTSASRTCDINSSTTLGNLFIISQCFRAKKIFRRHEVF